MFLKKASIVSIVAVAALATSVSAVSAAEATATATAVSTTPELLSSVDHVQWADASHLIATQLTDDGRQDYIVDSQTGQYKPLRLNASASDIVVAPGGKKAAYTNAAGETFVVDLNGRISFKISNDISIKPELVWSSDGKFIYFLQGDKGSVIAKMDIRDGSITKVLDDKVDYKANLSVSDDGKTFTYTVALQPKVTDPGAVEGTELKDDGLAIDASTEVTNIYQYDSSSSTKKPVQLSTSKDDKMYIEASADASSSYYVSVGSDATTNSALISVAKDKTVKTLFNQKDVFEAVMSGGKWYLLTAGDGANQFIYEVDAAGVAKQLYTVADTVTDIEVKDGSVAIVNDGHVYVANGSEWKQTSL
ncbi:TolB family protein [Cohnella yongneupensis]|uniref:TolB family protein n=1 Tax=Cohnella yongneupensis TaxID=425006 RepID=A0ABW0R4U4_9BACL